MRAEKYTTYESKKQHSFSLEKLELFSNALKKQTK